MEERLKGKKYRSVVIRKGVCVGEEGGHNVWCKVLGFGWPSFPQGNAKITGIDFSKAEVSCGTLPTLSTTAVV